MKVQAPFTQRAKHPFVDVMLTTSSACTPRLAPVHDLPPYTFLPYPPSLLLQLAKLYPIDAILITTPEALLGLPLLTACHPDAERWSVYCTLAALDAAKHLAAELCDVARRVKATAVASGRQGQAQGQRQGHQGQGSSAAFANPTPAGAAWRLPQPQEVGWRLPSGCEPWLFDACWHRPYDAQQAAACFARVTVSVICLDKVRWRWGCWWVGRPMHSPHGSTMCAMMHVDS